MTDSDELWQAYNEQGEPTRQLTKDEARAGALHGAVHIWIWHRDGERVRVLLQLRSAGNATWPGYLDASAAGHVNHGETPLDTATRETNEEIGAHVAGSDLRLLFTYRQNLIAPPNSIVENEHLWVYGLQLDPRKRFDLIDGEVESLRWVQLDDLKRLASDAAGSNLIPHGEQYFAQLFNAIDQSR